MDFACDFGDIAVVSREYQRVMDIWTEADPKRITRVEYEKLVNDPEYQVRRLLDFFGLGWDERCMRFYESRRVVKTTSYDQVRQPLYRSSLRRWENYAPYVPLLRDEALWGLNR